MRVFRSGMLAAMTAVSGSAMGQDAPRAATAAELLELLKSAGVTLPEGFVAHEDGTVSLPGAPAPSPTPESGEAPAAGEDAIVPGAQVAEVRKAEWNTRLNFGLSLAAGNTEQTGLVGTIVSRRTAETSVLTLDAGYYYSSEDGNQTQNRFTAGVLHDWMLKNSRWIVFADARYDYDEFRSFEHRVSAHAGLGYRVYDREKLKLTLRGGAGFAKEFGSDRDGFIPEALAGADFFWQIAENQKFEVSHRLFPDLDEGGEFRTLTSAGWNLALSVDRGLSFTVSLLHEYVSKVDPGIDNHDLKLFAGVSYEF